MKKILTLIMLLICTALILASCANSDLSVTVTENGGTIAYEYYVDKEIADEYFSSELPDGLKVCEIDEINERLCYVYFESFTVQSFDELEKKLCDIKLYGEDGMNVFSSASANSRSLTLTVNPFVTEDIQDVALIRGADLEALTRLTLKITMPYEIERYSEGTLSDDKRTLTLTLSGFDAPKSIEIKCVEAETEATAPLPEPEPSEPKASRLPFILLVIGGVALILTVIGAAVALCAFLIRKKKRKRAEAMPDTPIDKI